MLRMIRRYLVELQELLAAGIRGLSQRFFKDKEVCKIQLIQERKKSVRYTTLKKFELCEFSIFLKLQTLP